MKTVNLCRKSTGGTSCTKTFWNTGPQSAPVPSIPPSMLCCGAISPFPPLTSSCLAHFGSASVNSDTCAMCPTGITHSGQRARNPTPFTFWRTRHSGTIVSTAVTRSWVEPCAITLRPTAYYVASRKNGLRRAVPSPRQPSTGCITLRASFATSMPGSNWRGKKQAGSSRSMRCDLPWTAPNPMGRT